MALADEGERPDLRQRLEQTRSRLLDPSIRVQVVGEFKQGKSKLVNGLVYADVCPVDDDIATSVTTLVRYGETPSASLTISLDGPGNEAPVQEPIELSALAAAITQPAARESGGRIIGAEVSLPTELLKLGLTIVDSPGVGGFGSTHSLATLSALPAADAMLLVSDASQEFTAPEMQFLRQAMRICPNIACVITKIDLYPRWRDIVALDRGHLDRIDPGIPLFAVSSDLRLLAAREGDIDLNEESGVPALVRYLVHDIIGGVDAVQRRSVAADIISVSEHLSLSLHSELAAIVDPAKTPQRIAEMEEARDRADELRRVSSRWQVTLNDGIADLIADMEFDLRDRMRFVQRDADEALDSGDPAPGWDAFVDWTEKRVASAISDTFVWTNDRAKHLAREVARHFSEGQVTLPEVQIDDSDVLGDVGFISEMESAHIKPTDKLLIGMRGSYGGVIMIGLAMGMFGFALVNPFSIAAGVIIGAKVYKDEKANRLKRRQAEAKILVRKQLDEVIFQVGKQLKDRLRLVQRVTRDHFTDIAEEYHRSLADSVKAAQNAGREFSVEREQRATELRASLAQVEQLRRRGKAVASTPTRVAPAAPEKRAVEA
jgi:hypothetical protein